MWGKRGNPLPPTELLRATAASAENSMAMRNKHLVSFPALFHWLLRVEGPPHAQSPARFLPPTMPQSALGNSISTLFQQREPERNTSPGPACVGLGRFRPQHLGVSVLGAGRALGRAGARRGNAQEAVQLFAVPRASAVLQEWGVDRCHCGERDRPGFQPLDSELDLRISCLTSLAFYCMAKIPGLLCQILPEVGGWTAPGLGLTNSFISSSLVRNQLEAAFL